MIGSDRQGNVSRAARLRRESVMLASGPAFRIQEETNNCVLLFFFFFVRHWSRKLYGSLYQDLSRTLPA